MSNIKFLQNPGYLLDLLFLFMYHFNKEYCLNNFINYEKAAEDTEYFNRISYDFPGIPDELFVFFYLRDDGKCFLPKYYYYEYVAELKNEFDIKTLQDLILDKETLLSNIIAFYFKDIAQEDIDKYKGNLQLLAELIDKSDYNDYVKQKLCLFFINPDVCIKKLSYELMAKEFQLSQYYERNYKKIADAKEALDISSLALKIKSVKGKQIIIDDITDIYISMCLLNKNCVNTAFTDDGNMLLLGIDADSHLDFMLNQEVLPELDVLGNALSEKNRIGILELLRDCEEVTIKEVEKTFGISNTNAYYHLNLMIKANMVNIRNRGRTIMYSLNRKYFDSLMNVLKKFGNKK